MAMRGLHFEQVFVPLIDESKTKTIVEITDFGMQVNGGSTSVHPHVNLMINAMIYPVTVTKKG